MTTSKKAMMKRMWNNLLRKKKAQINTRTDVTYAVRLEVCCAVMGAHRSHIWHALI
jgi:hypothetical protein